MNKEDKLKNQMIEFVSFNDNLPFSNRGKTYIELYRRWAEVQLKFIIELMTKKEKELLFYELEIIKTNMNNILPDYKKKGQ